MRYTVLLTFFLLSAPLRASASQGVLNQPGQIWSSSTCELAMSRSLRLVIPTEGGPRVFENVVSASFVLTEDGTVTALLESKEASEAPSQHFSFSGLNLAWANEAIQRWQSPPSPSPRRSNRAQRVTAHYNPQLPIINESQESRLLERAEAQFRATGQYQAVGQSPVAVPALPQAALVPLPITPESLSSEDAIENHNIAVMIRNQRTLNTMLRNQLVRMDLGSAIQRIYEIGLQDYILGLDPANMTVEGQANFHQKIMRSDCGLQVLFLNYLPPRPEHVRELMSLFVHKLSELIDSTQTETDALIIAAWAKRRLIEIHPAIDGNTRAARALFDLVLGQVAHKKPHLRVMNVNLSNASIANEVISFTSGGQTFAFSPFNSDLKYDLNFEIFSHLDAYANQVNLPYFYVIRDEEEVEPPLGRHAERVNPMILLYVHPSFQADPLYRGQAPHWTTLNQFMRNRIENENLETLRNNQKLRAEAEHIVRIITQVGIH